jgi:magnesium transporter
MVADPAYLRAARRMGAILVTFAIELIVAFQIQEMMGTLKTYPLLISFLPVISAVSGNVGLQSGSLTARGIEVGTVKIENGGWSQQLCREMSAGFVLAVFISIMFYGVAAMWSHSALFGAVVALCVFTSTMIAAFSGTLAPMLFKLLGTDPIAWAGPLETGLQDVLGNTAFLYIASILLSQVYWE